MITTTQQISAQSVFVLRLAPSPTVQRMLDRYLDILIRHENSTFPKSQELSRFGEETCEICENESLQSDEVLEQLAQKIYESRRTLSNPFDGSLIGRPVVANRRVWEAWMLRHIREVCQISPIDEEPLEEGTPHAFGVELLEWENDLLSSNDSYVKKLADRIRALREAEPTFGHLQETVVRALDPEHARAGYRDLGDLIRQQEQIERMSQIAERAIDHFGQEYRASQKRTRQQVAATQELLERNEEALTEELRLIRETNAAIVSDLERQIARRDNDLRRLEIRARDSETRAQSLAMRLSSVESRLRDAEAQNAQNAQAAASGGDSGGCSIM